jgi:hypothetical protein
MSIFKRRWPKGEQFAGFFKVERQPLKKARIRIQFDRDRDAYPVVPVAPFQPSAVLAATLEELQQLQRDMERISGIPACGDYTEDKEVPGYCWGCTQQKSAHSPEAIAGACGGPSPQHRAECDCPEIHGSGKCQWPACEGVMRRELLPPPSDHMLARFLRSI